jgi:hypothetical protein
MLIAHRDKTIMAGLLIKELIIRGDLERCVVIAPGNLVEQWQDEMKEYRGGTPVLQDLVAGQIDLAFLDPRPRLHRFGPVGHSCRTTLFDAGNSYGR